MIEAGQPAPLGAHWDGKGVNFALNSGCAERVELCLFDESGRAMQSYFLPRSKRGTWHGYVPGLAPGQHYGYRVHGPWNPLRGYRCNPRKLLIDPYARALAGAFYWNPSVYDYLPGSSPAKPLINHLDSAASVPKCVVTGPVRAPRARPSVPWHDKVIYEANVRGYTMRHPDLPDHDRGRLRGLSNGKVVDYLKSLGITTIELQPVHAIVDEQFLVRRGLRNFWGYNSINFFSVDNRFAEQDSLAEFCEMVDALHDAGLEVFLDVVYNHTAEGGQGGPTLSFRGIDNLAYYRMLPGEPAHYDNVTGCGNAMNADNPVYQDLVLDSLAYWHQEIGLDGFRFDLATTLGRSPKGFDREHLLLRRIVLDERLADAHMIAEPWDVGPGGYQLGQFPDDWSEWNDRFRDDTRKFWRGDEGQAGAFAGRLHGSADIFDQPGRSPRASVNFVASHDGFTLADVVSYDRRHNEANGEGNRDGHSHNCSRNYGVEGATNDPEIHRVRRRQRLNMLASVLVAQGMPMLLAGDEFGNSQGGNNNAYCQDNEIGWLDWSGLADDPGFTEQVSALLRLRRETPLLRHSGFIHGEPGPKIAWMHTDGTPMLPEEWGVSTSFSLLLTDPAAGRSVLVLLNASRTSRWFGLPDPSPGNQWRMAFHTAEPEEVLLEGRRCGTPDLTLAVLLNEG